MHRDAGDSERRPLAHDRPSHGGQTVRSGDGDLSRRRQPSTRFRNSPPSWPPIPTTRGPAAPGCSPVWRAFASTPSARRRRGGEGLTTAREAAAELSDLPAFADAAPDFAEAVLKIVEALADQATRAADASRLSEAESGLNLYRDLAGKAADDLISRSRAPARLAAARSAVRKGQSRRAALAAMDAALKSGSAPAIYEARDLLVAEYPDLSTDIAVVERLTAGNELLRKAVRFDDARQPAETIPREDPLGPPLSLVLRSPRGASPDASARPVFALAEGFAYGLSSADGAPLWQAPVGPGQPVPAEVHRRGLAERPARRCPL